MRTLVFFAMRSSAVDQSDRHFIFSPFPRRPERSCASTGNCAQNAQKSLNGNCHQGDPTRISNPWALASIRKTAALPVLPAHKLCKKRTKMHKRESVFPRTQKAPFPEFAF